MDHRDSSTYYVSPVCCWRCTRDSVYVLLDNFASPRGCAVRQAVSDFWQWYFESSSTYNAIMASFITATVPDLTRTRLDILSTLQTSLYCNNQLLNSTTVASSAATTATTIALAGPQRLSIPMVAYGDFYSANTTSVLFSYTNQLSTTAMLGAQRTPTTLPLFYAEEIANTTATPINTVDYHVLPSFITSIVHTYNLQLSSTVTLNASIELVLDYATVMRMISGNISDWHDPRLVAMNPVLAAVLDGNAAPITFVFSCLNAKNGWPLRDALNAIITKAAAIDSDVAAAMAQCTELGVFDAFATCTDIPGVRWLFASQEVAIPALVSNTIGSIGYMMDTSSVLGNGKFAVQYPYQQANGTVVPVVRHSDPTSLLACAEYGFDATTLTIDVAAAALATVQCFPGCQAVLTQVPNSYPDGDEELGLVTVETLQWLYTNSALDVYGNTNMVVRTAGVPAIQAALLAALQSVTDASGNPLIRLPITWTLTTAISEAAIVLASIGGILIIAAMAITVRHSNHPVFRSSSPLFMLVSFLGLLHLCGAIISLTVPQTNAACSAFTWCIQLGFTLVFAPLFAKAYRIYRIFGRRKLKVVKLTNRKLLAAVAATFAVDVVYGGVWQAVAPATVVTTVQYVATANGVDLSQEYEYPMCAYAGQSGSFFVAEVVVKLAMLAVGVMLAFSTRQVTSQFNESKSIGLCIYNLVFAIGLIIPIMLLINAVGDTYILLLLFCITEVGLVTLFALFLPKWLAFQAARRAAGGGDGGSSHSSASGTGLSDGYSFLSFEQLTSPAMLQPYIAALERHLGEAKKVFAGMKRDGLYGTRDSSASTPSVNSSPVTYSSNRLSMASVAQQAQQANQVGQASQPGLSSSASPLNPPLAGASRALSFHKNDKLGGKRSSSANRRQAWSRALNHYDDGTDQPPAPQQLQAEEASVDEPSQQSLRPSMDGTIIRSQAAEGHTDAAITLPPPGALSEEWISARSDNITHNLDSRRTTQVK